MSDIPPILQPRSYQSEAPRRRRGWKIFAIVVTVLLMFSLAGNFFGLLVSVFSSDEEDGGPSVFRETVVGGDSGAKEKIAIIHVQDLISFSAPGHTGEEGMVGDIKEQISRATHDPAVKAIILRIETPGGEVTAADVIHHAVLTAKKKSNIPVVACLGSLAASGGYYIAVSADHIIAHPTTLTGSIGVIFHLWNYRGLMDKVGIRPMVFKSGKMKDMLSPDKAEEEVTPEEKEIVNRLVMQDYNRFLGVVAEGRHMKVEALRNGLADGRILSGEEALEHKFVDQLGYFEDATAKAKSLAHIEHARLIKYDSPMSLRRLLSLFATANTSLASRLPVGVQDLRLENGRLYYLPGGALR